MSVLRLGGQIDSALTHLAMVGLVAILNQEAGVSCRFQWVESDHLVPEIDVPHTDVIAIAGIVGRHAARRADPDSWVSADLDHEGRSTAVFSPRIKPASSVAAWKSLATKRRNGIDRVGTVGDLLDLQLIQALGEPAYWRFASNGPRPDEGASRWEMKTRNRGEEFVGNRLRLLATAVADRDEASIIDGLTGVAIQDECGKNARESRSSTGLTRPGPTDNALAWCALWGISQFALIPRVHQRSQTAGAVQLSNDRRVAPMIIPVPVRPIVQERFRSLVRSRELVDAGRSGLVPVGPQTEASAAALAWFRDRGIGGLMRFPVERVGSPSAPEYRLLNGVLIRTGALPIKRA